MTETRVLLVQLTEGEAAGLLFAFFSAVTSHLLFKNGVQDEEEAVGLLLATDRFNEYWASFCNESGDPITVLQHAIDKLLLALGPEFSDNREEGQYIAIHRLAESITAEAADA
jgi:hypothetical protein